MDIHITQNIANAPRRVYAGCMDKKQKKKIDVMQQKLQKLRAQLAGSRKQNDEPEETKRLEAEVTHAEQELAKLKTG